MANATEATNINSLLGSELKFLSPEEVGDVKTLDHYSEFYIRKQPSPESITKKIDELQFVRDGQRVIEITENWVVWTNPETGEKFIVNGNTRKHAYVRMQNTPSFKDAVFQPVPYRDFLVEPSPENLIRYQRLVNDTTESHDVLQLAETANSYKEMREKFYQSEEGGSLKQREAQKRATQDLKELFGGQFGDSYITRLKKMANAPAWIKELLRLGILTGNAIDALDRNLKKPENASLTEEIVISAVRAELQLKNETLISDKAIDNYFKARNAAANPPANPPADPANPPAKGGSTKAEKTPKTADELLAIIQPTNEAVLALDSDLALDTSKADSVIKLELEMIETLAAVMPHLQTGHRQQFFNEIRDMFLLILDNPNYITEQAKADGVIDKVFKSYAKLANASKKLTMRADDSQGVVELPADIQAKADEAVAEDEQPETTEATEAVERPELPQPLVISNDDFVATVS